MKKICSVLFVFASLFAHAQNKKLIVKAPSIASDIEKVARDYFAHFDNIKGEQISETENIIEYASRVTPHDALESSVIQIKSLENSYSWQASMIYTENYDEAVAKYKQLYRQLSSARIAMNNGKQYRLSAAYDAPDESRSFAATLFALETGEAKMKEFKIELALNYAMPEWVVRIYVYEKIDDEDIRPTVVSDY